MPYYREDIELLPERIELGEKSTLRLRKDAEARQKRADESAREIAEESRERTSEAYLNTLKRTAAQEGLEVPDYSREALSERYRTLNPDIPSADEQAREIEGILDQWVREKPIREVEDLSRATGIEIPETIKTPEGGRKYIESVEKIKDLEVKTEIKSRQETKDRLEKQQIVLNNLPIYLGQTFTVGGEDYITDDPMDTLLWLKKAGIEGRVAYEAVAKIKNWDEIAEKLGTSGKSGPEGPRKYEPKTREEILEFEEAKAGARRKPEGEEQLEYFVNLPTEPSKKMSTQTWRVMKKVKALETINDLLEVRAMRKEDAEKLLKQTGSGLTYEDLQKADFKAIIKWFKKTNPGFFE